MFVKIRLLLGRWLSGLSKQLGSHLYFYLALLVSLIILLDANTVGVGLKISDKAFDYAVKHRVVQAKPDSDIVIIDINQTSLSDLSAQLGSWPWPKQVFGELVEYLQSQKPKAIVFDLAFSQADTANPSSDFYFNEVIASSDNLFFSMVRMDPTLDFSSQVKYAEIPGIKALPDANQEATAAVTLPHFSAALKEGHLGTRNLYSDFDGVLRTYRMHQTSQGWQLPSLPEAVVRYIQPSIEATPEHTHINWRGKPFSYHYTAFSDIYQEINAVASARPTNEFTGKIVIIGSTGISPLDTKQTVMGSGFPSVEILATAIDSAKHHDHLKVWDGKIPYLVLSLTLVWLTALAFYLKEGRNSIALFLISLIGLLAISYIGLNLAYTYVDATAPILWAIAFFSLAKIYALATNRKLQHWLSFGVNAKSDHLSAVLMPILIEGLDKPLSDRSIRKIKRFITLKSKTPCNIDAVKGVQTGIWGLFGDMLVVSWSVSAKNPAYLKSAKADTQNVADHIPELIAAVGLPKQAVVRYAIEEADIKPLEGGAGKQLNLSAQWRKLLAQAVLRLEQTTGQPTVLIEEKIEEDNSQAETSTPLEAPK